MQDTDHRSTSSPSRLSGLACPVLLLLLVVAAMPSPAVSETADFPATAGATTTDDPHAGYLLCLVRGERTPMPLLDMDVAIDVSGIMSVARLTQRFTNPADTTVEATYVFPLPDRAAVRYMELRAGDRRVVSRIREREEARRTYEQARMEGKKTALIEQERPNLFTTSIANVNPGETVDVVLEYVEEVRYEDGVFGITFPLTFTPRYIPDTSVQVAATGQVALASTTVPDAARVSPPFREAFVPGAPTATFTLRIDGGFSLSEVRCLSHPADIDRDGAAWTVTPRAERVLADRDLRFTWRPAAGDVPRAALLTETLGDHTYGLFMLAPPDPETFDAEAGCPTRTLFILDVSGSMAGPSIEQARGALAAALDRLRPPDRFNILAFNQDSRLYAHEWTDATPLGVAHARGWVQGLEADGGTEIHPALLRGLSLFGPERPGEVSRIVFLTDGAVGNEAQVLQEVASGRGAIRIHAIGIGHSSNSYLIRKLAEVGQGLATFIFDPESVGTSVAGFLARVERPVLTDLELSWPGGARAEAYPPQLPDLHAGEPLFVSLQWEGDAPERIDVRGRGPGGDFTQSVTAGAEGRLEEGGAIPTRWARSKVEELTDARLRGGDPDMLREGIVALGLEHHLVTSFTSLVAVEERVTASGEAVPVPVANALPHGSQLLGTLPSGGTLSPLRTLLAAVLLATGLVLLGVRRSFEGQIGFGRSLGARLGARRFGVRHAVH